MGWGVPLGAIALVVLAMLWRRDQRRARAERAAFFSECLDLFESYRVSQDALAYPVLAGCFRGARVELEPIVDHLVWRKLPCLWIKATLFRDQPHAAILDFMARPRGSECFSPAADLPHAVALPSGWPGDAAIRTDDPAGMPPLAALEPTIALFEDLRMKELVVTPRGVRLVMLAGEARRPNYAVVRQIDFDAVRLARADAERLLDAALALADRLASPDIALQAA